VNSTSKECNSNGSYTTLFFLLSYKKTLIFACLSFEQLKKFKATHLEARGWYLDCHQNYTPDLEVVERTSLDGRKLPLVDLDNAQEVNPRETHPQEKAPKKKRLSKKEKEEIERVAKEKAKKEEVERKKSQGNKLVAVPLENCETTSMSIQGNDDGIAPIAPDSSLSNVVHANSKEEIVHIPFS